MSLRTTCIWCLMRTQADRGSFMTEPPPPPWLFVDLCHSFGLIAHPDPYRSSHFFEFVQCTFFLHRLHFSHAWSFRRHGAFLVAEADIHDLRRKDEGDNAGWEKWDPTESGPVRGCTTVAYTSSGTWIWAPSAAPDSDGTWNDPATSWATQTCGLESPPSTQSMS